MSEPITETIHITIEFSKTASVNLTTTTVITGTYQTEGTVYLPYLYTTFNPMIVITSFILFTAIGVMMKKPTSFIIAWIGFVITGVLSDIPIYYSYVAIAMIALFMMYHAFRYAKGDG